MTTHASESALTPDLTYGAVHTAMLQHARQELLVLVATLALGFQLRVFLQFHGDSSLEVALLVDQQRVFADVVVHLL
jgi:hypothetical protein